MNSPDPSRRRGRWLLVGLALLFFGPVLISWFLYFSGDWRPDDTVNHGRLIDPAVPLAQTPMPLLAGGATADEFLHGFWTLIQISGDGCGQACANSLYVGRQIRAGLGRERERVQRVLVSAGAATPDAALLDKHEDLIVIRGTAAAAAPLATALGTRDQTGEGTIFLADPLGNLVLIYAPDAPPAGVREDLRRLMKLSRIG